MKRRCSIFGASPVLTEWATHPDGGVSVTFSSPLANPVYLPTLESKLLSVTTLSHLFLLFSSALLLSKLAAPGTPSKTADISTDPSLHIFVPAYCNVIRLWTCKWQWSNNVLYFDSSRNISYHIPFLKLITKIAYTRCKDKVHPITGHNGQWGSTGIALLFL
jgi:hypothetical protein